MPVFTLKAIDTRSGKPVTQMITADDVSKVLDEANRSGLVVLNVKQKWSLIKPRVTQVPVYSQEKAHTLLELGQLINAGVPLDKAIECLIGENHPGIAASLRSLKRDIESGYRFHEAAGRLKGTFSVSEVQALAAAEASGSLGSTLSYLGENVQRLVELQKKVRSALTYPSLVLGVTVLILLLMVFFIVPSFAKVLGGVDKLPPITRGLVSVQQFIIKNPGTVFGALVLLTGLLAFLASRFKNRAEYIAIKIPGIGRTLRYLYLARFCRTLALLLKSGIQVSQAVVYAGQSTGSRIFLEASTRIGKEVEEGQSLSSGLRRHSVFTPMIAEMSAVGENSGQLIGMMTMLTDYYEKESGRLISGATAMLEPAMVIIMGLMVAFLSLSVFSPMVSMIQNVGRF